MGGIFDMISGAVQMGTSLEERNAEMTASDTQWNRERRAANVAIEGAQEKGAFESAKQRMMTSQLVAKQRQAYEASGVDSTQGTAASVQANTAALGEMDAQQVAVNAAREAWGYKEQRKQSDEEHLNRRGNIERKAAAGTIGGMAQFGKGAASLAGSGKSG